MIRTDTLNVPDYLVMGTITKDIVPSGFAVGGTVTYGAITASRLGETAAVVTSAAPDLVLPDTLEDIHCVCIQARNTTTFHNVYEDGTRRQYVQALSEKISADHIPFAWRSTPLVHLGPLVAELDESLVHLFPSSRVVATPQGWFRSWDETGYVSLGVWQRAGDLLPYLSALVLSEEDMRGDPGCIDRFVAMTRTVVVTQGARGCTVYHAGEMRRLPPRPAHEVDPTGAGDVFAAAFIVRLHETALAFGAEDPWEAARFANVVASFSVEGPGISAIPDRQQVESCLSSPALAT